MTLSHSFTLFNTSFDDNCVCTVHNTPVCLLFYGFLIYWVSIGFFFINWVSIRAHPPVLRCFCCVVCFWLYACKSRKWVYTEINNLHNWLLGINQKSQINKLLCTGISAGENWLIRSSINGSSISTNWTDSSSYPPSLCSKVLGSITAYSQCRITCSPTCCANSSVTRCCPTLTLHDALAFCTPFKWVAGRQSCRSDLPLVECD